MSHNELSGRVALITGSGQGLGLAMAAGLAAAGAQVILNGRGEASLKLAQNNLTDAGHRVDYRTFDVTDYAAAQANIADVEQVYGHLDILINNVGARDRRSLFEFALDDVPPMLAANFTAPFELSRLAAIGMRRRQWGRIINVSSVVAQIAGNGDTLYTAVKGAVESLTRVLAAELGPYGITVNCISPGFFATSANAARLQDDELNRWLESRTSLRRWAEAEEISGPVVFLASDAASYVTGHTLVVDGGMVTHL